MRLFQMMGFGKHYLDYFAKRNVNVINFSFVERKKLLLEDRYGAVHILKPVYDGDEDCSFSVVDDDILQKVWAKENGLKTSDLNQIILAQIENHRSEVLYNNDPIGFPSSFIRKLPGCVKKTIAWRAAPSRTADFSAYDLIVSNFDSLNAKWKLNGWKTDKFFPSIDPEMYLYAEEQNKTKDVFFAGSFTRTTGHDERLNILKNIASMNNMHIIDLRLQYKKWGRLSNNNPWRWIPAPIKLPRELKQIIRPPVYGRELYKAISKSKIVINPATNIAGDERGNMRCWESMGCGACMLGSKGRYPEGFIPNVNFIDFIDCSDLKRKINILLNNNNQITKIAKAGTKMLRNTWSKERQWQMFKRLIGMLY